MDGWCRKTPSALNVNRLLRLEVTTLPFKRNAAMSIDPKNPSPEQHPDSPMPGEPDPLTPGRTDVNPDREPGIDQLPGNEGVRPIDQPDDAIDPEGVQTDTDHAEHDGVINPR